MTRLLVSALFIAVSAIPLSAFAQEVPIASSSPSPAANTGQLESCFNYYRFGSVPVTLTSDTVQISQGAALTISVIVTNQNSYPVNDISILGKVFYKKDFNKNSYGPDVIQLLTLGDHITLGAGQSKQMTYTWKVPPDTQPGNYQIAAYVDSYDRFNLAGLPFTNDVVGNLFNFSVVGIDQGAVRFDNTQTYVNGLHYHSAVFSPQTTVDPSGTPIKAIIDNTMNRPFEGSVHWELYSWDGSNPANLITQSDQHVQLDASSSAEVSYKVTDTDHTVYYVVGQLKSSSGQVLSVLPVRYVQSRGTGLDLPRIAFFGVATSTNASSTGAVNAFVCVHSTGHQPSQNVKVDLLAAPLDPVSWLLHLGRLGHATYTGSIPGALSAVSVPLSSADGSFKVTASLYQGGALIDRVSSTYSCTDFDICSSSTVLYAILVVIGILILVLCWYFLRRRHNVLPPASSQSQV